MIATGRCVRWRVLAVCVAFLVGATLLPPTVGATSIAARSHRFVSCRMSTVAAYSVQPDQNLPASATATIGRHVIVERMVVRDSTHYRVDVQTLAPGIDAGTLTVTVDGQRMVAYDSRTGEAVWNTITGPVPQPTDIQIGRALSPMAPTPDPGQSYRQYLAMLHQPASVIHPFVHLVGHTHLLGHPVAILDYGALMGTGSSICTRPSRRDRHPLCHAVSGTGRARLWVATDRPVLLRYTEGGFAGLPAGMMRQHYLYRVTSFQFRAVPLPAVRYTPPGHASRSAWLQPAVIGGGDTGWFAGWPEPWRTGMLFRAPPPSDTHGNRYSENGVLIRRDTLIPIPSAIGVLYYRPQASPFPGVPPAQFQGAGPYVYLQERNQIHGLPSPLRQTRRLRRGHCTLWTGSYGKGLPWMALSRHRLALLVSTIALTERDLIRYGFGSLC